MSPVKIVIFEDEFLLANDLKRQIQQFNFEVTAIFRKAEEGLDYLAGIERSAMFPDIILMDISLAGKMNGLEAGQIITRKYDIALVFLTGMSQLEIFEEAFKSKPHAFMIKPFEIQQALVSIRLAVYQKTLENTLLKYQEELEDKIRERTRELQQEKDHAEEAVRLKNTLLANVSNQIREPMLGIMGMAAMLKDETMDKPDLQRYTQYIDDNVKHLFSLLKKIMDLREEYKGEVTRH
jgi:DNA-binding NarL/FixJ family response regulator